jgi:predicted HTH transcriptional regulator
LKENYSKINIVTLDPFSSSELDTTKKPKRAERSGRIHIKTSRSAIRNVLLIKKNKPFDSLLVKESAFEWNNNISRACSVSLSNNSNNSDSIDINIRVLDS